MLFQTKGLKMKNRIKIDIISDVMCPWCVVGYKRLEKAINELKIEDKEVLVDLINKKGL